MKNPFQSKQDVSIFLESQHSTDTQTNEQYSLTIEREYLDNSLALRLFCEVKGWSVGFYVI